MVFTLKKCNMAAQQLESIKFDCQNEDRSDKLNSAGRNAIIDGII
jgi:hypothetical protein